MASRLRIISDRNIPFVEQAFAELGEVVTLPASQIDAAAVRDADLLLCRTTIQVNEALLRGSKVRFVATATIGTDHLDLPYLAARNIPWAAAPGSNAPSVALWFACVLATLCRDTRREMSELRIGVVGVGHVGKRIAALAEALGPKPLLCDPPRSRLEGDTGFVSLDEIIERCDVVSLHVPLVKNGPDATRGLLGRERIERLPPGTIVVNACRGDVLDAVALGERLARGDLLAALDVFPGEPSPDPHSIAATQLATPHIAGHSLDGKVAGTDAVYRAACAFLGVPPTFSAAALLPAPQPTALRLDTRNRSDAEVLLAALTPFYDLAADDRALRALVADPTVDSGAAFRAYRDGYPARREPREVSFHMHPRRQRVAAALSLLGATISA